MGRFKLTKASATCPTQNDFEHMKSLKMEFPLFFCLCAALVSNMKTIAN